LDGEKPEDFNTQCGCGGILRIPFDEEAYNNDLPFDFRKDLNKIHIPHLKLIGTIFISLATIFWLFVFFPIGILCILLLMAWIGKKS
jgi:hypothetical protein